MTNEEVQMNEETQPAQEEQHQAQEESVDYKTLYLDEVQNAKKLRKRAQDAETTVQDATKESETLKVKTLKEQEKYKELYEETNGKLDHALKFQEKWETHESTRREHLLSKLPEEDREKMGQKDLETLEYIVSMKEESKPVNPAHVPNQSRNMNIEEDWTKLDEKTRRENWGNIMQKYKKN